MRSKTRNENLTSSYNFVCPKYLFLCTIKKKVRFTFFMRFGEKQRKNTLYKNYIFMKVV